MNSSANTKVQIGSIYHEHAYRYPANQEGEDRRIPVVRFWGDIYLRRGEFRTVPGAIQRDHGWGFDLPASTPQSMIDRLSAPIYALPIASQWTKVDKALASVQTVEYQTVYKSEAISIIVWERSLVISSPSLTLSRIPYYVNLEAHHDAESGVWSLKDRYTRRAQRNYTSSAPDDLTAAARRECWRIVGGLVAYFLDHTPQVMQEGANHARQEQRESLNRQINDLQKQINDLLSQLAAIPADLLLE